MGKTYYTDTDDLFKGLDTILANMEHGPIVIFDDYTFPRTIILPWFDLFNIEDFVLRIIGCWGEYSLFALDSDGFTGKLTKYDLTGFTVEVEDLTLILNNNGKKIKTLTCESKRDATNYAKRLRKMILKAQDHIFVLDQRTLDRKYIEYSHDVWL